MKKLHEKEEKNSDQEIAYELTKAKSINPPGTRSSEHVIKGVFLSSFQMSAFTLVTFFEKPWDRVTSKPDPQVMLVFTYSGR